MIIIIVSIICLGLALYLYKKKEATGNHGSNSSNGSGTGLYGKSSYNSSDGSYITTKWFMILLVPIFPLGSYRVIKGESKDALLPGAFALYGKKTGYQMTKVRLNWKQVIITYIIAILIVGAIIYFGSIPFRLGSPTNLQ